MAKRTSTGQELASRARAGEWPADKVDRRPVAELVPYARNARTHSDEQVAQIAASIREWGWTTPVLVDEGGQIIAGHGRVMAARKLGIADVPVMVATGWSEAQKQAYVLADNQLALNAGWDMDLLKVELGDLQEHGFDLGLIGFDAKALDALLAPAGTEGLTDPDEVPEAPVEPVTRPGDVWLLGRHRITCGDSTSAIDVERVMQDATADILVSDPPYGIGFEYADHNDADNAANADLVADVFALAPRAKCWTPGLMNLARDLTRFGLAKVLVWHKGFAAAGNGLGGASTWEPVLVVDAANRQLPNDYLDFKTERVEHEGKSLRDYHPCPKPVKLYAHLIECLSPIGAKVYEPFSGSGTTLLAAEMTGRTAYAIELSPAYVDVAVTRWEKFTGQAATLEGDGRTFAELLAERSKPGSIRAVVADKPAGKGKAA